MCDEYLDDISLYVDNMLDDNKINKLKEHMNSCEECKQTYENLVFIKTTLQDMEDIDFPENLHENIMSKIEETKASELSNNSQGKIIKVNFSKQVAYAASIVALLVVFAPSAVNIGYNLTEPKTSVMADDLSIKDKLDYIKEHGLFNNTLSIVISTDDVDLAANDLYAKLDSYTDKEIYENGSVATISLDMTKSDVRDLLTYILSTYDNTVYSSSKVNLIKDIEAEIERVSDKELSFDNLQLNDEATFFNPKNITVNITIKS